MDSLTAGIALILVQCCLALVMVGFYFAAPSEKCTKYWAFSGICIAPGVLVAIFGHSMGNGLMLLIGTTAIMAGMTYQLQGVRAFYKLAHYKSLWNVTLVFVILLAAMLIMGSTPRQRTLLFSGTLTVLLGFSLQAIWHGQGTPRSFVQALVPGAIALLLTGHILKLGIAITHLSDTGPVIRTGLEIATTYLVPIVGSVLFSIGLPLLYFERLAEENRHLATHDELSKLLNRRAIVAAGEREVERAARLQRSLSVAFIDIDLFKHFNDEFGHAAGDAVITEVACILTRTCRAIDLVGRYGGEEFLIVLPDAGRADAVEIGRRLVNAVHDYRFLGRHPVTISVGLATLPMDGGSWEELLMHADTALYRAKNQGRDRFCTACT